MKTIKMDVGIKEYKIGEGGVLMFNPTDPNVYERFGEALKNVQKIEDDMVAIGQKQDVDGFDVLKVMADTDKRIKEELNHVFGMGNDFNKILCGVNVLAVASNGERVITNLLAALSPIVEDGIKECAAVEAKNVKANRVGSEK